MRDFSAKGFKTYSVLWRAIVALLLSVVYLAGKTSPSDSGYLWGVSFIIPLVILLNVLLVVFHLVTRSTFSLVYIAVLAIGGDYIASSFGGKSLRVGSGDVSERDFAVVNYNSSSFGGVYPETVNHLKEGDKAFRIKGWIMSNDAEIQCYQEFLNFPGHPEFDVVAKMKNRGLNVCFAKDETLGGNRQLGVLLATSFPIVKWGQVQTFCAPGQYNFNRILYADLLIQRDTIRVINFHLASMGLKNYNPFRNGSLDLFLENTTVILARLKRGVLTRDKQVDDLIDFVEQSPYPVICAGDFNDIPYSHSYQRMRSTLENSFEQSGRGLGFTYNGRLLRFLRIDNQFFSKGLQAIDLETLSAIEFTDHFPLRGTYIIAPDDF